MRLMAEDENKQYRWIEWNGEVRYGSEEEYRLIKASIKQIFQELDKLVKDPDSITYQHIKNELTIRTKIKANPFAAGRHKKYREEEIDRILVLRKEGKTYREISKLTNISLGTISTLFQNVQK